MGCRISFHFTLLGTIGTNSFTAYRSSVLYKKLRKTEQVPPPYVYLAHPPFTQGCESLTFILKNNSFNFRENVAQVQIFYETTATQISKEQPSYSINDFGGKCNHFVF